MTVADIVNHLINAKVPGTTPVVVNDCTGVLVRLGPECFQMVDGALHIDLSADGCECTSDGTPV